MDQLRSQLTDYVFKTDKGRLVGQKGNWKRGKDGMESEEKKEGRRKGKTLCFDSNVNFYTKDCDKDKDC